MNTKPSISISDASAFEYARMITFTVSLSHAASKKISVPFTIGLEDNDVSAAVFFSGDWQDAMSPDTTNPLIFQPGEVSKTITVNLIDDSFTELMDEHFFVNLGKPTNARLGDALGIGTIKDDDFFSWNTISLPNNNDIIGVGTDHYYDVNGKYQPNISEIKIADGDIIKLGDGADIISIEGLSYKEDPYPLAIYGGKGGDDINCYISPTPPILFIFGEDGKDIIRDSGHYGGDTAKILVIDGGKGNDIIDVGLRGGISSYNDISSVLAYGREGNDTIELSSRMSMFDDEEYFSAIIDGGPGNDLISSISSNGVKDGVIDIRGGLGRDTLQGGSEVDLFEFGFFGPQESKPGEKRDVIENFTQGQDEIFIGFSYHTPRWNNKPLKLLGFDMEKGTGLPFTGSGLEIRQDVDMIAHNSLIQIDLNGDKKADMEIMLIGFIKPLSDEDIHF